MKKNYNTNFLIVERKRHNLSQKLLADFTGLSLSTIVRAERGESIRPDCRQRLCEYFNKSADELGLIQVENIQQTAPEAIENTEMSRRQAIQLLGVAGTAFVAGTFGVFQSEPWEQLSRALSGNHIEPSTLTNLEAITQNYWQLRSKLTAQELLNGVQGHLLTATQLLQGSLLPEVRKDLCTVAGEIALIAGQISFDMNNYKAAQGYYKSCIDAAIEGENDALQSSALGRMSFIFTESNEPEKALLLLLKAQKLADSTPHPILKAWLKVIEAEIHANNQNVASCSYALESSEDIATKESIKEDVYWSGFNNARLAGYKGACFVKLQKPDKALDALQKALELDPISIRHRLRVMTDMATAYIQQNEIEKGCSLATQALGLTKQTKTLMILPRLQKFRQVVGMQHQLQSIRDFDEQLMLA